MLKASDCEYYGDVCVPDDCDYPDCESFTVNNRVDKRQ